jgi:hypothetical protein
MYKFSRRIFCQSPPVQVPVHFNDKMKKLLMEAHVKQQTANNVFTELNQLYFQEQENMAKELSRIMENHNSNLYNIKNTHNLEMLSLKNQYNDVEHKFKMDMKKLQLLQKDSLYTYFTSTLLEPDNKLIVDKSSYDNLNAKVSQLEAEKNEIILQHQKKLQEAENQYNNTYTKLQKKLQEEYEIKLKNELQLAELKNSTIHANKTAELEASKALLAHYKDMLASCKAEIAAQRDLNKNIAAAMSPNREKDKDEKLK